MNSIIETCSDSSLEDHLGKYGSRSSDISMKSLKKSKKSVFSSMNDVRLKRRNVPPSTTQVILSYF